MEHLVVVGASLAGIRAVESARRAGHTGRITLVGAERHLPYDRPPLSKAFLDDTGEEPADPRYRTEEHLRDELGVELRLGSPATSLDTGATLVGIGDGSEVSYDALVVATGGAARMLPGTEHLTGVHALRTWDDALAVRSALDAGARTVVIGAGFIGSEVASSARKRGLSATIVETLPVPLVRSVGEDMGTACADLHREHGTDLRCGETVDGLESSADGAVTGVRLGSGEVVPADLVVVGIGVSPCTEWLAGSGVELHERDRGVVADATLRAADGVYAAGDVVHFPNHLFDGEVMRLEHWTTAAEQGALAAKNALDPANATELGTVPYFWSDWYSSRIQFVGRPAADEIRVVSSELGDDRFLALYRRGDRLVGTITIDRPTQIMKYKRLISKRASWAEALEFAGVS
ncbi:MULTISPECIES: NAD(P)/FAD-dependent oxidoreductase [Pseudonocardia]|uniref:NADPH-dependent 2,4-dienoyl-CoA reductase/sulfur reductase-like enzyme n=1 Tax=Pseudonocardia alni TaxID=33907 RepID=A0A852W0Y8_PSEA5|nr:MULTISPECIES: FAD-dependent oxidoreductase [Pseudonocardia]MCO7193502.1 FAD-dependent oxidoreductase [Pseudonocardia sp. McavD-2-B]MYW71751.1 FAD-dependent oxidoreductase [Pseudonocardia sp. SID8383]NYG02587.1 NADPH-dependent 2,4-dienoyl-CoA reductase/sulfur reductase-like enzyme [Pseudonocardia antarctica]OJG06423.1 Rhodocoxin reductase [Pseudonocardia autotrophica]